MLTTIAVAGLVCVASALVGEAAALLLGLERRRPWTPAVGLTVLMALTLLAVKLPGHGDTAAVAGGLLIGASAWALWRGGESIRPPVPVAVMSLGLLVAGCIPYISSGRFGLLGVSFNNDLSAHLQFANWIGSPDQFGATRTTPGYPVGPHSLVAAISHGFGIETGTVFDGLMLALPVLAAWSALGLLDDLPPVRRVIGAALVPFTYSLAAAYGQVGFKEYLMVTFLLAMVGISRAAARAGRAPWQLGIPLGFLGGGIVFSFSYGGLAWPIGAAFVWAAMELLARRNLTDWARGLRAAVPALAAAVATGALLLLSDIGRLLDSVTTFGTSPAGTGSISSSDTGNLLGQIPKKEVFGIWPREDFRYGLDPSTFHDLIVVFAVVVGVGAVLWWLWQRDLALPAAAITAGAILVYLSHTESAYTAGKAYGPAAALIMTLAVRPLLSDLSLPPLARIAQVAVMVAFAAGAVWSSYLALRGTQIGPTAHSDDLADLRPLVAGKDVLFLGRDDYMRSELRGAMIEAPDDSVRTAKPVAYGDPVDVDSSVRTPKGRPPYLITTRSRFRSELPQAYNLVRTAGAYELWRRTARAPRRRTLAEGGNPGRLLDCSTPAGRALRNGGGWARIWTKAPLEFDLNRTPIAVRPGGTLATAVRLPAGAWELSLDYLSPQDLDVRFGTDGRATMPASLDRPGPFYRFGVVRRDRPGFVPITMKVGDEPLGAQSHVAQLLHVAAVPLDAKHRFVPLSQACGRYVDWYTKRRTKPKAF